MRLRLTNTLKPWQKYQWCISQMNGAFVAAMEDVLDLYTEPYDPQCPVACFDETSTQLLADVRQPLPAQPGRPPTLGLRVPPRWHPQPLPVL